MSKRADGRDDQAMRGFACKVAVTNSAQGSAYVERTGCKVMCSVYGPKQLVGGDYDDSCAVRVNYSVAAFAEDTRRPNWADRNPSSSERHLADAIENVFERTILLSRYPKSLIELNFLVIESDQDVFSACIASASLALAQAGIEMRDMVVSATSSLVSGDRLLLDPSELELETAEATVTVTALARQGAILSVEQKGVSSPQQSESAIQLCCQGCLALRETLSAALEQHHSSS